MEPTYCTHNTLTNYLVIKDKKLDRKSCRFKIVNLIILRECNISINYRSFYAGIKFKFHFGNANKNFVNAKAGNVSNDRWQVTLRGCIFPRRNTCRLVRVVEFYSLSNFVDQLWLLVRRHSARPTAAPAHAAGARVCMFLYLFIDPVGSRWY